jgi:hypothetical protein
MWPRKAMFVAHASGGETQVRAFFIQLTHDAEH